MPSAKNRRRRRCAGLTPGIAAATLLCLPVVGMAQSRLSDAELRGKELFTQGTSATGGEVSAIVGDEGVVLPGSALTCSSCHGDDGRGRPEGGVEPPDIRWSELTKTYGHVHGGGRRHPAFDEESFARLMREGVDGGDNRLDRAMPLYEMSDDDLADLVAYLKRLETDADPGVLKDRVQVATLLPLDGPAASLGSAMAQALHAHFADINAAGGVFGRQVDLLAIPMGASAEEGIDNLRSALASEDIFALVGAYTIGIDTETLDLLRDDGVPLVGPFTLDPGDAFLDSTAFYLYPGLGDQARALADRAVDTASAAESVVVVAPDNERSGVPVAAVEDQFRKRRGPDPVVVRYAEGAYDAAAVGEQIGAARKVIFLGNQDELESLLTVLAERNTQPEIYTLSSLVTRPLFAAPAEFDKRIFLAYPTYFGDVTAKGRADYIDLAERHGLPPDHLQAQIVALASARLFVEGLQRAGRELSRSRFVGALEALYAFQTGLTPPLSYGPNRRIGARGAHIVSVDLVNRSYAVVDGGWRDVR